MMMNISITFKKKIRPRREILRKFTSFLIFIRKRYELTNIANIKRRDKEAKVKIKVSLKQLTII